MAGATYCGIARGQLPLKGNEMFKIHKKSIQWGNETLTLETGKMARQADGSVVATYGETTVHAAVVFEAGR